MKHHQYRISLAWTGNAGEGTRTYQAYRRDHEIRGGSKSPIPGSSDPAFRGDPARYSPEELLVSALAACHMLWYLHLCSAHHLVVIDYRDQASGEMDETADGGGQFTRVVLHPAVVLAPGSDPVVAGGLHAQAHELCFIARSVNFPVITEPEPVTMGGPGGRAVDLPPTAPAQPVPP